MILDKAHGDGCRRGHGRRRLCWLTAVVFALAALPLPAVTLIAPNGGESWVIGSPVTITWTPTAAGVEVRIVLFRGGTTEAHRVGSIKNSTPGDRGSFAWEAGNFVGGRAVAGDDYYVRVLVIDGAEADASNAPFSLLGTISVTTPMETAAYEASTSIMNVAWSAADVGGNVRVDLERQDGPERYVIRDAVAAGGSPLSWPIPLATAEGTYRVRVSQGTTQGSSGRCHIMAYRPPHVRVLQPNGGEELVMGRSYPIRWQPHGLSGNLRVELLKDDRLVGTLSASSPVGGMCSYNWDGKTCGTIKLLARGGYKIRVTTLDGLHTDVSDAPFSLALPPNIILFDPQGGDTWISGTVEEIRWNATKLDGYLVTIDLYFPDPSRPAGVGGFRIARDVPGTDRRFPWTVGTLLNTGSVRFSRGLKSGCTIRLLASKDTSVLVSESKPFNIETR
jgi:hypothetical protein